MNMLESLRNSWIVSLTVLAVGGWILMSSLPDFGNRTVRRPWQPKGTLVTGSWLPLAAVRSSFAPVERPPVAAGRSTLNPATHREVALGQREGQPGGESRRQTEPAHSGSKPSNDDDPTTPAAVRVTKYRVRSGDRYWTIAERCLGRGERWPEIQQLNPEVPPNRLREGTIIRVPLPAGSRGDGVLVKNETEAGITPRENEPARPRSKPRTHRVKAGESLSEIGKRYYTDGDWRRIFDANRDRLSHPHRVERGTVLVIPSAPGKERGR
ncbi:MAG: LysM peptidoglycan-binding domain-containing protein [Planctomycetes bacterium]|nr:LysM peptidoglycan-binding domain-containing protein [Planctomycetota bacterium]